MESIDTHSGKYLRTLSDTRTFIEFLYCGSGLAYFALKDSAENREKYLPAVMWGLTNNVNYNVYADGSRGAYLFRLVQCYEDKQPFLDHIIKCYFNTNGRDYNLTYQFADELYCFALAGYSDARKALRAKHDYALSMLHDNGFHQAETICDYANAAKALLRLATVDEATDIFSRLSALVQHRPNTYSYDKFGLVFLALFTYRDAAFIDEMTAILSERGDPIADEFRRTAAKYRQEAAQTNAAIDFAEYERAEPTVPAVTREETDAFLRGASPAEWIKTLTAMQDRVYTGDPLPLMACTWARDDDLADAAWNVLKHMRHSWIRRCIETDIKERAYNHLAIGGAYCWVFNDTPENHAETMRVVYDDFFDVGKYGSQAHNSFTAAQYHTVQAVLDSERYGISLPADLYEYALLHTQSNEQRLRIVCTMHRKGYLTKRLAQVCHYDSSEAIRTFVQSKYPDLTD